MARAERTAPSDPWQQNVLFEVWLLSWATLGRLDAALAPSGLTADEFGLYSALRGADGMTPTEIARWIGAPATTVSSAVKRLERRGHVVRERNPADGRSFLLRLTDAGRAAHEAAAACFAPVLAEVDAALGRREPGVRRALRDLHAALAPRDHTAG